MAISNTIKYVKSIRQKKSYTHFWLFNTPMELEKRKLTGYYMFYFIIKHITFVCYYGFSVC